jgi:hypothetical protein
MSLINGKIIGTHLENGLVAVRTDLGITVAECEHIDQLTINEEVQGTFDDSETGYMIKGATVGGNNIPIFVRGARMTKVEAEDMMKMKID